MMLALFTVWIVQWRVGAQRTGEDDERMDERRRMDGRRDVALDSDRRAASCPPGCRD